MFSAIQDDPALDGAPLCLQNQGSPRLLWSLCEPRHDELAVGAPSFREPGAIDLPAIRVVVNEALDPLTVSRLSAPGLPANVQLWRVGRADGTFVAPEQVLVRSPLLHQDGVSTEILFTAAVPVAEGIYLVNVTSSVTDLPGNGLRIDDRPNPSVGGYDVYEAEPDFQLVVPPGYRIYFKTLVLPTFPD